MLLTYFLPTWFQAIKGVSAFESGIHMIPMVLSLVGTMILNGQVTSRIGYYVPAMILGPILAGVGAGLITTLNPSSSSGAWIGYQVLFGLGLGLGAQASGLAAQATLKTQDVSIGTAIMFFMQQLGGAIFVSVGENLFINSLASGLSGVAGLDPHSVINTGATKIQKEVPAQYLPLVLSKYNHALTRYLLSRLV